MEDFNIHKWRSKALLTEQDHEVSMAQSSLESIIRAANELVQKIGQEEKDIPAWIQDHITNAENYINQANKGYYEQDEYQGGSEIDEMSTSSFGVQKFINYVSANPEAARYLKFKDTKSLINYLKDASYNDWDELRSELMAYRRDKANKYLSKRPSEL